MKRNTWAGFYALLCPILFLVLPLRAQSPFDDLQAAYDQYSQGKFKAAAATFDKYFSVLNPTAKDYYFAAICNAQAGNKVAAIALADKAAYGIETYAMMLADEQMKPVHAEIRKRYDALEKFYLHFNSRENQRDQGRYSRTLDSLYWSLPVRRLNVFDYPVLSRGMKNELALDTARAMQVLRDAIASSNVHAGEIYRTKTAEVIGRTGRYLPPELASKIEQIARDYEFMSQMGPDMMQSESEPEPKVITQYLLEILYTRGDEAHEALTTRYLKNYYQTPEGQATLRYWVSMNIVPTILASDEVFPYAVKEYSESQRLLYDYIQSKKFDTAIPRHFDIYRADATGQGKQYTVPRFQSSESPANKDWKVSMKIIDKKLVFEKPSSEEKLVLLKKGTAGFAENAGDYHKQPAANLDFIRSVKDGKFKYYTIALIQDKHLEPLTTVRILARLKTNIESDDETFLFAIEANMRWVSDALPKVINTVPAADRMEAIEFIRWYGFAHPQLVDYTVSLMTGPDLYSNASPTDKRAFRRMLSSLDRFLPNVFDECPAFKENARIPDLYSAGDDEYAALLKQGGLKIAAAWNEFKKENPYGLPAFLPSKKTIVNEVTENSDDFFIENGKPVFYDPYSHRVFKEGKTYSAYGDVSTASYSEFVKSAPTNKAALGKTKDEPVVEEVVMEMAVVEAAPDEVAVVDDNSSYRRPLVKGASFDGTAYVFTPSHHTNSNELLTLKASKDEISRLVKLSGSLGLNPNEYVRVGTDFNIYYDRFYAFNAFGKIAVFCHDNDVIFSGFLDKPETLTERSKTFHGTVSGICKDKQSSYTEKASCLNMMQVEPVGDRLAVMASISVSGEPYCSSGQYCRTTVKLLDKDLNIVKERMIPGLDEEPVKFNSNTDIKLVVKGDRIFAFVVPQCCGPAPMHVMVFDKDLNVIVPLREITGQTGQIAMLIPSLAVTTRGDELLIAYPVNRNNDILLELRKVSKDGTVSKAAYLEKVEGVVTSNELTAEKSGLAYQYVEKEGSLYFFKKLEISWSAVDKLK